MKKIRSTGWFIIGALLALCVVLSPLGPLVRTLSTPQQPLLSPAVTGMLSAGAVQSMPGTWSCEVKESAKSCSTAYCTVTTTVSCVAPEKIISTSDNPVGTTSYTKPLNSTTWTLSLQDVYRKRQREP